jgi:hypothetical protein
LIYQDEHDLPLRIGWSSKSPRLMLPVSPQRSGKQGSFIFGISQITAGVLFLDNLKGTAGFLLLLYVTEW